MLTVERIDDADFMANENKTAGVLPALYVDEIAVAAKGAWPCALDGVYGEDAAELRAYAHAATTSDGFQLYLKSRLAADLEVA